MVPLLLILMFSCSWAFGYTMQHPGVSYWIPVLYTMVVILGMSVPAIVDFISLRRRE
jgi:hypothetical protein